MLRYGLPKILCWLVFNNLVQARVISEETTTTENLLLSDCLSSVHVYRTFLDYWSGIAWPTVCIAIPGQVVLCCVRQQPDHNPVSSTPLLYFLPWVLALVSLSNELLNYKLNIPFFIQVLLFIVFYFCIRNLARISVYVGMLNRILLCLQTHLLCTWLQWSVCVVGNV